MLTKNLIEIESVSDNDTFIVDTENSTNKIKAKNIVGNKANKSVVHSVTVLFSGWSGEAAPYSNTISVTGVTADNNVELVLPADVTVEQIEGYQTAQILNAAQSEGRLTLYAWGEKPSVDLPMTVIVRGD